MSDPRSELEAILREEGGLLAGVLADPRAQGPGARGGLGGVRALAVAAIREAHDLHGGAGGILATDDPDLALLAGDRLYALGLDRLAGAADLEAVEALAEVIAAAAAARGAGDEAGAEAAWEAGIAHLARRDGPSQNADR